MPRSVAFHLTAMVAVALPLGCGRTDAVGQTPASGDTPSEMVKLSTFGLAQYCSIATGLDGTIHALFTDSRKYGSPHYVYYRASADGGATWSDAKNLSDDESGLGTSWCQIKVDAAGRAYAIWKYVDENTALDGPGGNSGGVVAFRCLDGGTWSRTQRFGDDHHEAVAWCAMNAPDGKVRVLYTQLQADIVDHDRKTSGNISGNVANDLAMLTLDGANPATRTPILTAKPLPTPAEIQARHEAGKDFTYEASHIQRDGLWNLRGYVAEDGRPHFIAERYQASSSEPKTIVRYDGQKLATFYEYKNSSMGNTFSEPPAFFRAADGKEHFVRKPEASESEVIRDYVVDNGTPGDPTDVIANPSDKTKIFHWQANALADGRIAAFAALSPKGMYDDADDLYVAIGDGRGKWGAPLNVTDNDARAKSFAKAAVSQSSSYQPESAEAASLKGGDVGVIMVNTDHTITGLNTVAITGSGRAVEGLSSTSSSSPYVFFTKVKG